MLIELVVCNGTIQCSKYHFDLPCLHSQDLKRMYKLFSRVQDGLKQMLDTFFNFIVNTGNEAIRALMQSSKKNDKLERADSTNGSRKARSSNISDDIGAQEYVETLLDVHSKFSEMVRLAFDNDQHFTSEMDKVRIH